MINIFVNRKRKLEDADRFFISWPIIFPHFLLYLTMFVLFFLSVLPTGYVSFHQMQPAFLMMAVFYWSIFPTIILPISFVFAIGMIFDLFVGFPMGLTAVLLLSVQWVSRVQRKFLQGQSFMVLWLSFILICCVVFVTQWAVFCLFYWRLMLFTPVIANTILTILLFPFMVVLFHKIHRNIAEG